MSQVIEPEVKPDDAFVLDAVKAVNRLNVPQLVMFLRSISAEFAWSANDLRNAWCREEAGKVWDIAAEGLEKTADEIQKHWDTL